MSDNQLWHYDLDGLPGLGSLTSYTVRAQGRRLGRVLRTEDGDYGLLMVNTGPWLFGRLLAIPAGLIGSVDHTGKSIDLTCDKAKIKAAPQYQGDTGDALTTYRNQVSDYYDQTRGNRLAG